MNWTLLVSKLVPRAIGSIYLVWVKISPMITVYGTVCLDRIVRVPRIPDLGGFEEAVSSSDMVGGEASNTSIALVKWGNRVRLIGNPIGRSREAVWLARSLDELGVTDRCLPDIESDLPYCLILVTDDGERTMIGRGFSEMERDRRWDGHESIIGEWFTADSNHGDMAREAVAAATGKKINTYLMDFTRTDEAIPRGCWWQSSFSWAGASTSDPHGWVATFSKKWGCYSILTAGRQGLYFSDIEGRSCHLPCFPVDGVVDTTGAGDVFRAGMLHGLSHAWKVESCLAFASAAAALNCQGLGATGGLRTEAEILALIDQFPHVRARYERITGDRA